MASDAWKSSTSGLLQALESLPGIETGWADEESAQELAGAACDACNRSRWASGQQAAAGAATGRRQLTELQLRLLLLLLPFCCPFV